MVWSSLAPKWPILVPFCGMDDQKSKSGRNLTVQSDYEKWIDFDPFMIHYRPRKIIISAIQCVSKFYTPPSFLLEIRDVIKILKNPCYAINVD